MPGVDIAIPCYQYGRFLRECVESVLSQGIRNVRILIIDNASSDNTLEVARRLAAEDERIEILARETNQGPHASFNAGVDWASSEYFMVLCADDLLAPGSLKRAVSIMEQNRDVSFAYGNDVHCAGDRAPRIPGFLDDEAGWVISTGERFIGNRCRAPEQYIAAGMVLVRTSAQKQAGHYRPELPHTDDFEMLLRLALLGSVAYTPAIQGIKRIHGSNRTDYYLEERTRDLVERLAAIQSFFSQEGSTLPQAKRLCRLGTRSIAERAYWCGIKDLVRGRKSSLALLRLAFRLDPKTALIPPFGYLLRFKESTRGPADLAGLALSKGIALQMERGIRASKVPSP